MNYNKCLFTSISLFFIVQEYSTTFNPFFSTPCEYGKFEMRISKERKIFWKETILSNSGEYIFTSFSTFY